MHKAAQSWIRRDFSEFIVGRTEGTTARLLSSNASAGGKGWGDVSIECNWKSCGERKLLMILETFQVFAPLGCGDDTLWYHQAR